MPYAYYCSCRRLTFGTAENPVPTECKYCTRERAIKRTAWHDGWRRGPLVRIAGAQKRTWKLLINDKE